MSEEIVDQS